MTQKEIENISLDFAVLMQTILNVDATSEETANCAIMFAKQFLNSNPTIKKNVGNIIGSFDDNDADFNQRWDINIEWLNNWDNE